MKGKINFLSLLFKAGLDQYVGALSVLLVLLVTSLISYQFASSGIIPISPVVVLASTATFTLVVFSILMFYANAKITAVELSKELTTKIAQQSAHLDSILSALSEPILTLNPQGKVMMINPTASEWLGPDILNQSMTDFSQLKVVATPESLFPEGVTLANALQLALEKQVAFSLDQLLIQTRLGDKYCNVTLTPVITKEVVSDIVVLIADVTLQVELQKRKDEFVSIVTHQLKTPMTALNWHMELLAEAKQKEIPELIDKTTQISSSLLDLTNSLLNLGRIESGRIGIKVAPVDLPALVEGIARNITAEYPQTDVQIDIAPELSSDAALHTDSDLLSHVVMNLLHNAVKYSQPKHTVSFQATLQSQGVLFAIEDAGPGIPDAEQSQIFSKFFRASNTAKQTGTGLGLHLVQVIVELLGGSVWFASQEKQGSTFYLWLPLQGITSKEGTITLS